jgi:hypothetical protein
MVQVVATTVARITVIDHDQEASDRSAHSLLTELQQLDDVRSVDWLSAPGGPDGARSAELLAIGTLLMTIVAQPDALAMVVGFLQEWRGRQRRGKREVEVEIELDGRRLRLKNATKEQVDELIDVFRGEVRR